MWKTSEHKMGSSGMLLPQLFLSLLWQLLQLQMLLLLLSGYGCNHCFAAAANTIVAADALATIAADTSMAVAATSTAIIVASVMATADTVVAAAVAIAVSTHLLVLWFLLQLLLHVHIQLSSFTIVITVTGLWTVLFTFWNPYPMACMTTVSKMTR